MGWAKQVVLVFMVIVLLLAAGLWAAGMRSGAGTNEYSGYIMSSSRKK